MTADVRHRGPMMISLFIRRVLLVVAAAGFSANPACGQWVEKRILGPDPQNAISLSIVHSNGARTGKAQLDGVMITCQDISASDDPEVEAVAGGAPPRKLIVTINRGSFEQLLLNSDAITVRALFEERLPQKLNAIDRLVNLSETQKEKLRLAGRGDIKRFFDRAAEIEARFGAFDDINDFEQFENWATVLSHEIQSLRRGLSTRPFQDQSLFAKTLKVTLSPEQAIEYARAPAELVDAARVVTPASQSLADKCWDKLGLRLEKADPVSLGALRNRYRGGMRVVEVRTGGVAEKHGIRKGDILVGLGVWETARKNDINFILNRGLGREPLKYYVVRGQEVLNGNLQFPPDQ